MWNKTAELSQRRPRDAPNIWVPWKVLKVLTTHQATFPEICSRLLFRWILRMCVQKLKFVASPVPEIIGGTKKISAVPGYAHAPFSPKICELMSVTTLRCDNSRGHPSSTSATLRPLTCVPILAHLRSNGTMEHVDLQLLDSQSDSTAAIQRSPYLNTEHWLYYTLAAWIAE